MGGFNNARMFHTILFNTIVQIMAGGIFSSELVFSLQVALKVFDSWIHNFVAAVDKAIISHFWSTSLLAQYYISQLRKLLKVQSVPLRAFTALIPTLCQDFTHIPHQFHGPPSSVLSVLFISHSKMHLLYFSACVSISPLPSRASNKAPKKAAEEVAQVVGSMWVIQRRESSSTRYKKKTQQFNLQ